MFKPFSEVVDRNINQNLLRNTSDEMTAYKKSIELLPAVDRHVAINLTPPRESRVLQRVPCSQSQTTSPTIHLSQSTENQQ